MYNENFRGTDFNRLKDCTVFGRSISDTEHPWKLTEKRVEDAWFTYALICYYSDINKLNETNFYTPTSPAQRSNIDFLCGNAWECITQSTNKWIHHKCTTKGCIEGILF